MSGTNKDTINYFPIYMRHCTVFQPNKDEDKVESAAAVYLNYNANKIYQNER